MLVLFSKKNTCDRFVCIVDLIDEILITGW